MVAKSYPVIEPIKLRYKGLYDMKGLIKLVYNWYIDNHFRFHEELYKDKVESPLGNEIEIKTNGDRKVSEYYKNIVKVYFHQWESKDVIIKVGGKDVSMVQGRIEILVSGEVITDWQGKFKKGTVWEKAQKLLEKSVIIKDIEIKHIDPLDKELHVLAADIKRFLRIESA
jgi:hypothetical protein